MVAAAMREPRDDDGRRDRCHEGEKLQAQKNCAQAKTADGTQEPAEIEPGGTQYRVQCIAFAALEPAARHAVVVLGMPDERLDGLAALEPFALHAGERLVAAAMNQLYRRDVRARRPVSPNRRQPLAA